MYGVEREEPCHWRGTGGPGCIVCREPRNLSCTERWEGVRACVMWGSWGGEGERRLCWGMREFLVSPTSPSPFQVPIHPITPGSQEAQPDSIANVIFKGSFICMEHALLIHLNTAPLSPPRSVQTVPAAVRKLQGVEGC